MDGPLHIRIARFLFSYRITPQSTTGRSPAELLFGRHLRSKLDFAHPDATKQVPKEDRRPIRSFEVGDKLFARNFSGTLLWIPVIVRKVTGPLSYQVETQEGITLKRHSDQLKWRYTVESSPGDNNGDTDECDDFPIANNAAPETPPPAPPFPAPPLATVPLRRSSRSKSRRDHGPFVC